MGIKGGRRGLPKRSSLAHWSVAQFSAFYAQNRFELINHANRIVKDRVIAEEISQEALVKFMLAAPELESNEHALSYLHRTVENLCIDVFRADNRRPNLVALDDVTAEVEATWQISGDHSLAISAAEDAAIIRKALSLLSPAERSALVLWEVEGRSTAEIAKELGIKESAVRHTVSRARASLRKILTEFIIDERRGLTALDLLSTTYNKTTDLTNKSSKIVLTFILVLTAFLGFNSITGNDGTSPVFNTAISQLPKIQDFPFQSNSTGIEESKNTLVSAENSTSIKITKENITATEFSDHMSLSSAQLETIALMLEVLEQANGGDIPSE